MEGDGSYDEADWHGPHCPEKEPATTHAIYDEDADDSEDPVYHSHDRADCDWVREADNIEQSGGVV